MLTAPSLLTLLWMLCTAAIAQEPSSDPTPEQQASTAAETPPTVQPIAVGQVPDELADWVPWITSRHPDLGCPVVAGNSRSCMWPGVLTIDAGATGANLALQVHVDRPMAVPLPGGAGTWPQTVRVDGRAVPVLDVGGVPTVALTAGRHRITATTPWTTLPNSLPIPAHLGLVELTVDGIPIEWPRIDGDGLRLGAVQSTEREGERLDLDVSRRVSDGVPVVVETVVVLRASGAGREHDLGQVHLPGTRPVSLTANLPARFDAEGSLVVQVRPGTWELRFEAVHEGAVASLSRPPRLDSWPEVEYWAVATDDRVRAVNLEGVPGVDPARTTVPEAWRALRVHAVDATGTLTFDELRRGEPEPAPNQLTLHRDIWVDFDGGGLTVRDRFGGTLNQGWRLEVQDPATLGHVSAGAADQVITDLQNGRTGVELRGVAVDISAESRIEGRPVSLPAVGWHTHVQSLEATLHLPPGWALLAGTGVDSLDGSILDRWTLFDLFFVLIVSLATGRLLGPGWGALALMALMLARHETGAPQWTWAVLLVVVALARVVPAGWPRTTIGVVRGLCLLALTLQLVPFAIAQVQTGLFPVLERPWQDSGAVQLAPGSGLQEAPERYSAVLLEEADSERGRAGGKRGKKFLSSQVDPSAVVQTGPGVPAWSWEQQPLRWSGPVSADHTMRLLLIGPLGNGILSLLQVLLLMALGLRLAEAASLRAWAQRAARTAPMWALMAGLGWASSAHASPSSGHLAELERRLVLPPPCAPHCVDVPSATLQVTDRGLVYDAEVHAGAATAWPVPGPTGTWVPRRVVVDGVQATAMARLGDGFLHVRLDRGVHRIRVEGPLPPSDVVALGFGQVPRHLTWNGDGWALDGHHADGSVDASVQLARMLGSTTTAQSAENLSPWLEVHRELDLGVPWRVRTTVKRVGPTDYPVVVKVPLLPGEAVTEGVQPPDGGEVSATLDRDQRELTWLSSLQPSETVVLTAPTDVPWTEVWSLSCSPVFHCTTDGPAPLSHTDGEAWATWLPTWRVWPGETVSISVVQPPGIEGQTVTIDSATLMVRPGRRQLTGELALSIRSSQGGRQAVTLPDGARLQGVTIDQQARPLQLTAEGQLLVPIQPGAQEVAVTWQQDHPPALLDTVPAVDVGGPAVNVTVVVEPLLERWIAVLVGPRWGPVPLMWTYVWVVLGLSPLLARAPWSPLATWQWALLGLGMTQVPTIAPMLVAAWLIALAWRRAHPSDNRWVFNGIQLGLVALTIAALVGLYGAIHSGLLWQPDMQVAGGSSSARRLVWFVDRTEGPMPRPSVVSLPMWTWRVAMLAWSLWLAASLLRWLPDGFRAWTTDGWYRDLRDPRQSVQAPVPDDPLEPAERSGAGHQ